MELIWNEVNSLRLIARETEQAEIEGTLPPPAGRRVTEILDYQADVAVDGCRIEAGKLNMDGRLTAKLVVSDESGIFAFSSESAFSHTVKNEAFEAGMTADVLPQLAVLTIRLAPDERILLSAAVDLEYVVTSFAPLRVLSGVSGVADMEFKSDELPLRRRVELGSSVIHLSDEISSDGADAVLSSAVQLSVRDTSFENGGVTVSGVATVNLLCRSSEGELIQLVRNLPFRESVETNGTADEVFATAALRSSDARALGTEFSLISFDSDIELRVFGLKSGSALIPLDAFSPTLNFSCLKQNLTLLSSLGGANLQHSMRENVSVPDGMPDIFTALLASAHPTVTSKVYSNGEMTVDGLLPTRLIYRSSGGSVHAFMEEVPFSLRVAAPAGTSYAKLHVSCSASVTGGSGRTAQIAYNMDASVEFFGEAQSEVVAGLAEENTDCTVGADGTPASGLIIHAASSGEDAFDIAKRFRIPSALVRELNPDLPEKLSEGEKVLLIV